MNRMQQWESNRLRTANSLNNNLGIYREIKENYFSYFLKDNSGLSFLSGETLSTVGFGCLFCAGVELRFLGGIAVPTYFTKKWCETIQKMLSSLRRRVRRRKFKALYTSSVATIQQPRLPDTPLSLCVRCVSPFHTAECFCCGWGNYYIPRTSGTPQPRVLPVLHQLQSKHCGHRHHTANRRVCVLLQAIRRMRCVCKDAPHSQHKKNVCFCVAWWHKNKRTQTPDSKTREKLYATSAH